MPPEDAAYPANTYPSAVFDLPTPKFPHCEKCQDVDGDLVFRAVNRLRGLPISGSPSADSLAILQYLGRCYGHDLVPRSQE